MNLIVAVLALLPAGQAEEGTLAVKAGRIIPVSGEEIEGGVLLVQGGKITAVGKGLEIPWDAKVIDASKKVVIPGYVEAHSFRGLDRPNERMASVPFVSTFDSINPVDPYFEDALRQGITTILILPGNDTMIGGQGCIVRPTGVTTEAMIVARDVALKISLRPRSGVSRMAHLAALRRELEEASEYAKDQAQKKEGKPPADPDPKREPMIRLLKGLLPAFVYCPTASDALKAMELAETYKFRMKLVLGPDGWKAADEIARRKFDVILAPDLVTWETDEEKHEEVRRFAAGPFAKHKVPMAFQTDTGSFGSNYLWHQAATAVKYGVPRSDALRAVTLAPAEFLGLGARVGSLQKGKDANFAILTGDPLDAQTWVDTVVIEGKVAYERSKDERLKRALDTRR